MYLPCAKLMTLKLDNDRNLRQGARGDVQPKTSKMFRHAYIRVRSSETSESYAPERGARGAVVAVVSWDEGGDGAVVAVMVMAAMAAVVVVLEVGGVWWRVIYGIG
uniref:Uncharacterized protein n=1 Tax=Tanacetum cinerariifolium TaxID=118510 RepID=A0A699HMZ9_TANCI|nr:hypothetical protein [Tanacetum cinerariifolium]